MRIVHFDQMFHPEFGDQINILSKFQVKHGHEVFVITGKNDVPHPRFLGFADLSNMDDKDKAFETVTGVKIVRIDIKCFISGRAIFKKGHLKIVDNLKPDILFCHFNDTVIGMFYTFYYKKLSYPVVFDSHMLEMASVNPLRMVFRLFYKIFITPIIKKNKLKVIRTQDDKYVNRYLGIPEELTPFISFGSDTSIFCPDENIKRETRLYFGIDDHDFVVTYTGKLSEGKGGKILAEAFKNKFETKRRIVLVAVGTTATEYEKEVDEIFNISNNIIIRVPTQRYIDLPKYYQMADVCIFPKQCSLSFYDAQACGLPVIAEDNNINIIRLSKDNGYVYRADDIDDMRSKIMKIAEMKDSEYDVISNNALKYVRESYDYEEISRKYTKVLNDEYERFHEK